MKTISLTVNGNAVSASVEPRMHLADFLRDTLNLTGTHLGCEHGVCGACTLMVNGAPVRSCITLVAACDGAVITTIEGHDDDELMCALREAFRREHALQCGYCTPGMLASARDVVLRMPNATARDIRIAMSGNLCRCTGYIGIVRAVQSVISERKAGNYVGALADSNRGLGPVGARDGTSTVEAGFPARKPPTAESQERVQRQSPVFTTYLGDFKPQATLLQSFVVNEPRRNVWAFLAKLEEVASCIPGTSIKAPAKDGRIELNMRIKVGPIVADFDGVADVTMESDTYEGFIYGIAHDTRSRSATRGRMRYRLTEESEGEATRVEVEMAFTVTGPFAQFSRSAILNELAKRVCGEFAQNLEARLKGETAHAKQTSSTINAGALIISVFWQRLKSILRALFK